jgi:hypothetical protein
MSNVDLGFPSTAQTLKINTQNGVFRASRQKETARSARQSGVVAVHVGSEALQRDCRLVLRVSVITFIGPRFHVCEFLGKEG